MPDNVLDATLHELQGLWLEIECGNAPCTGASRYPLRLMGMRQGGVWTLRDILPRLRCKRCQSPPASVALLERGDISAYGPHGWRVELVPALWPEPAGGTSAAAGVVPAPARRC